MTIARSLEGEFLSLHADSPQNKHPKLRTWVRFPSPAPENEALTQRLHFPFFPNPPKSVPFLRETSVALSRSNLVSVANKRVKQILRRSEPWSSPRSEAREASDIGFDTEHLWHSPGARRFKSTYRADRCFSVQRSRKPLRIHGLASMKPSQSVREWTNRRHQNTQRLLSGS